jgi:thiol-disulfide isomerase/thioredoxin
LRGFIGPDYTIEQKPSGENVMNNEEAAGHGGNGQEGPEGNEGNAVNVTAVPEARPRFRPAHFILIGGLIALIVIFAVKPAPTPAAIGQLPKFNLVKIAGGDLKSEDLKGKVAIIDFWASWCSPCKVEIPQYNKVVASMAGKDFQMIGYAVDSGTIDDVRKSAQELGIQYPVVMATDEVTAAFGNYRGLPTTFIIGKNGKIYKKYEGTSEGKVAQIAKDVEALLSVPYTEPIAQLER